MCCCRGYALLQCCFGAGGPFGKALHSNVLWLFKTQSQVRNKSPDNCITVQPVSFVKYTLHPACQSLKSWAGSAQDWKWQKQIATAAISAKEYGHLNAFLCILQGVLSAPYESIISSMQGDPGYNYPLWSTSPVTTMRRKVNMLSGAVAFVFPFSSSKPVSWGRTNQNSLGTTHPQCKITQMYYLYIWHNDVVKKNVMSTHWSQHTRWYNKFSHNGTCPEATFAIPHRIYCRFIYQTHNSVPFAILIFHKAHKYFKYIWQEQVQLLLRLALGRCLVHASVCRLRLSRSALLLDIEMFHTIMKSSLHTWNIP